MEKVAVLGASNKEDRYSNMAVRLLMDFNHEVYPLNPVLEKLEGLKVYKNVGDLPKNIDTLTLYVNPKIIDAQIEEIIKLKPGRVIFNPGTESEASMNSLKQRGIAVVRGCTLVMLKTGQF